MGQTKEGRESNRLISEEFHGQTCLIQTTNHSEYISCSVLIYLNKINLAATVITTAGTSAMTGSRGIVFFHEDATSIVYEFDNLTPEFMSRCVQPRGSSGE